MPQTVSAVQEALNREGVTRVELAPDPDGSDNVLGDGSDWDTDALTVPADKTLLLEESVDLLVAADNSVTVNGTASLGGGLTNHGAVTVNSSNTLKVTGTFTSDGSLTVSAAGSASGVSGPGHVVAGQGITVTGGSFSCAGTVEGPVRMEGGSLNLADGELRAADTAIALSVKSGVSLTLTGGRISNDGTGPALALLETPVLPEVEDLKTVIRAKTSALVLPMPADWAAVQRDDTYYYLTPCFAVTLNTDGGTISSGNVTQYTYGVGATLPTAVTKEHHSFAGWYDNAEHSGTAVTAIGADASGNKTFYAAWTPDSYTVTLNTDGGTISSGNVTQYTYGVGATLPAAGSITKDYHSFAGWYDNEEFTGEPVTAILATDTGDKTFYAKWTRNNIYYTLTTGEKDTLTLAFYGTEQPAPEGGKTGIVAAEGYPFDESAEDYSLYLDFAAPWSVGENEGEKYFNAESITSIIIAEDIAPISTAHWFYGCAAVSEITGIEKLHTSDVTDMSGMFSGCGNLVNLNLTGFDTANVKDMSFTFRGCGSLTSLDVSSFNTGNVMDMSSMFSGCSGLTKIYASDSFTTANVTGSDNMFSECTNLVGGADTAFDSNHADKTYARIDGGRTDPGYFTAKS